MDDGFAIAVAGNTMYQAGIAADEKSSVRRMAVFQSMDEGKSWTRTMLHKDASVAKAIAVRQGKKALIFAGGQATAHNPPKSLLYKSMNGGATWSEVAELFGASTCVNAICFDPTNPRRVFVAADNGIWTSDDEGVTWTAPKRAMALTSIVANSSKSGQLFAGSTRGVLMSNDGGKSWSQLGEELNDRLITRLEIDAKNGILYAGTNTAGVMRLKIEGRGK